MADLRVNKQWLIEPNADVKKKWIQCQVQERKSQIVRLEQDIEDLKNGQIVKLEATIIMLKKEMAQLKDDLLSLITPENKVIDV